MLPGLGKNAPTTKPRNSVAATRMSSRSGSASRPKSIPVFSNVLINQRQQVEEQKVKESGPHVVPRPPKTLRAGQRPPLAAAKRQAAYI